MQIRLPSDLTGPSAIYTTIVGNPRYRADSQADWQDLQHHARQTVEELNYILEPRPEKGLYMCIHDEEPRATASRKASGLNFNKDELVVVVCTPIRNVIGPFRLVVDSVLSDGKVLRQFG